MGFGIRIFVAVLLALISLSVLSLHVALCFHYPSSLFAVTLLLNPSLWLFVGLISMFCTFVLSYRDKRRKLVPALCTSCRPKPSKNDSSLRFAPRSRCDCNRTYQLPSGKGSERSLLTCHYSSYSSVHTSTHLLTNDTNTNDTTTVHNGEFGKVNETFEEDKRSLLSFDSSSKLFISDKNNSKEDVQNYSCLVQNFRDSEIKGSTLVVLNRDGQTKNFYVPQTHGAKSLSSSAGQCSRTVKPYVRLPNCALKVTREITDTKSDSSSGCADNESDSSSISLSQKTEPYKIPYHKYYPFMTAENLISNSGYSPDIDSKYFSRNRCTCPRRKYTHTNNEIHFLGKSNKPIMKCTKSFKRNTPLHLFRAKENIPEDKDNQVIDTKTKIIDNEAQSLSIDKSDDISTATTNLSKNSQTDLISREPDTLTSIVSLLD